MATSVTRNAITWTFDADYTVGQYVNGDYYVVAPSGLTINSTTPASSGGYNGSMVNPTNTNGTAGHFQGFDSSLYYYDAAAGITFPYAASAGDSIVTVQSYTAGTSYTPSWNNIKVSSSTAKIQGCEVLTVVSSAPAAGTFRPPFMGTSKPTFTTSDITEARLPNYAATTNLPSDLTYYERGLERPWLMTNQDWTARAQHPMDNMPNYHEQVVEFLNEATVLLLSENRTTGLLNGYVQLGIDWYYAMLQSGGTGSSSYTRIPIIIAGYLLGNTSMEHLFLTGSPANNGREGKLFYKWDDKSSAISSSIVTAGQTWTGQTVFFRKQVGNTEHEHLHPSEWGLVANGGGKKQENYRVTVDVRPHVGLVLASRAMSLDGSVNHDAYLDYMDRWFDEDYDTSYKPTVELYWGAQSSQAQTASKVWVKEMWTAYRNAASDPTAPDISNIVVTESDTSATITWDTDKIADSLIDYGLTSSYGSSSSDTNFNTSHSIQITGLTAETTYHYQITSADPSSNSTSTVDATFTTLATITTVADPTSDNPSGDYWDGISPTLSTGTAGASIYYTTDGTAPDSGDSLYSTPISVSSNQLIRFIGIKDGLTDSAIVDATYNFGPYYQQGSWSNITMDARSGTWTQTIYIYVDDVNLDLTIGHADGNASAWADLATTFRILNGTIDARNSSTYAAENVLSARAGVNIRVDFTVYTGTKTYDMDVKVGNDPFVQIANGYGWRTGTTASSSLNRIGHFDSFDLGVTISQSPIKEEARIVKAGDSAAIEV